jgi:hypothetical protein
MPMHAQTDFWRRGDMRAAARNLLGAFVDAFRDAYLTAFPPESCAMGEWLITQQLDLGQPSPLDPGPGTAPAGVIAMADGALLYEIDGEPCSGIFVG